MGSEEYGNLSHIPLDSSTEEEAGGGGDIFDLPPLTLDAGKTSTSGVDWSTGLGKELLPMITQWANKIPGLAQALGPKLQNAYGSMLRQAMGSRGFQGTLNELSRKNMIVGTPARDTMAETASRMMMPILSQGYDAGVKGLQAEMNVPSLLANLTKLNQSSTSHDDLAVYREMFDFINN